MLVDQIEKEIASGTFRQGLLVEATKLVGECIGGVWSLMGEGGGALRNYFKIRCKLCGEKRTELAQEEPTMCPHCKRPALAEYEQEKVHAWWIVSRFLGERIEAEGAPIIVCGDVYIWGRVAPRGKE